MKREVRTIKELRAEGSADEMALVGFASRYNVESHDLGGFREVVAPSAFVRSLKENADVKATFNHNPDKILGRSTSGTLTLTQNEKGLQWRCALDSTSQLHRDIYASVKRGDISECSFAFCVDKEGQKWEERKDAAGENYLLRTLLDVDLMDVSAVVFPAYPATNVDARSLWPDGEIMEIRSAIDSLKRSRDDSNEAQLQLLRDGLNDALLERFGYSDVGRKYWVVETYEDHIVVVSYDEDYEDNYFTMTYEKSADSYTFGEAKPVELDWVPSERAKTIGAEYRTGNKVLAVFAKRAKEAKEAAAIAAAKPQERAHSTEHVEGDCADAECACQNRMVDPEDVWCEDDPIDGLDESERKLRSERKAVRVAELRKASDKVLTKSVDGKNLTADKFAYVGNPEKTETWKLPIMDKDHAQNALARFNQTQGIPAAEKAGVYKKIVAAAKKFGIDVSEDDTARMLRELPYNQDEVRSLLAKAALIKADL
jgi:HK97 family phage prohead protease